MAGSPRCAWIAAIFAFCFMGCADLLAGELAAGLVALVASTEDNLRKSRSVSVIVGAAGLALHRKLLPAHATRVLGFSD